MNRFAHLTTRFFTSVRPRPVDEADRTFVELHLTAPELECWQKLEPADKAESVAVAHRVAAALGRDVDERWLAAALLHDVGKSDVDLTPLGRAWATVVGALASHGRARLWPSDVGRYIAHDELGAAQLRAAGARPEVVAWAEAHHRRELWAGTGIPLPVCEALAAADG